MREQGHDTLPASLTPTPAQGTLLSDYVINSITSVYRAPRVFRTLLEVLQAVVSVPKELSIWCTCIRRGMQTEVIQNRCQLRLPAIAVFLPTNIY